MASQDDAVWYVLIDNAQRGPLRRSQVLAGLRDDTVNGADLVWRPGFEDWLPLREVREFWTPPSAPERKPETTPPPLPQADIPSTQLDEKWSLWGAATWGLVLSAAVLWMSALTTGSYRLASTGQMPSEEQISYLIGELSVMPLLFVMIAEIRNAVRRRSLRPSSVSAGWRATAFFGILIAVGFSLKIFGALYFSRDEVIAGEARDDMVKSFLSGCMPSQRALAANSGATDAQIESYCNCIASDIVGSLTYKQMGALTLDKVKQAITTTAAYCRPSANGSANR